MPTDAVDPSFPRPRRPRRTGPLLVCSGARVDEQGRPTNLGDEAATVALQSFITRRYPGVRVLAANTPTSSAAGAHVAPDRFALRPIGAMARRIAEAPAVVLGGGTLLQVEPGSDPRLPGGLLRWLSMVVGSARALGVPVAFCGIGAERLDAPAVRAVVRAILRGSASVSCRDESSQATLAPLSRRPVLLAADTTFLDSPPPTPPTRRSLEERLLVNLSPEVGRADREAVLRWLADHLAARPSCRVVLVPTALSHGTGDDASMLRQVADRWPGRCSWFEAATGVTGLSRLAAGSKGAIGSRLHFLLLAAQAGSAILPLPVNDKGRALCRSLGRPLDVPSSLARGLEVVGDPWLRARVARATDVIGGQLDTLVQVAGGAAAGR